MARGLNPQDLTALVDALAAGDWVSGEQLAARAGVSRAALAKRMLHLRRWGLEIEGHPGRGYRLLRPLQRLQAQSIRAALASPWREYLRVIVCDVTDSTNTQALAAPASQDPQVCLAEMQTAGRGRRGRRWVSPFGANLYLSLAWSFATWPAELPSLSLVAGVALLSALEEFGFEGVGLKWPNDLLWQGRKLAGILLEQQGEVHAGCRAVIGIGVNFDMQAEQVDEELLQPWCSLAQLAAAQGHALPERNALAARIVGGLAEACHRFAATGFAGFVDAWSERDLTRHRAIEISGAGETRLGRGGGIDPSGALILLTERGAERVYAGDVSLRLGRRVLSERLLLIDVGNSRLKWATATTRRMSRAQALAHDGDPAAVLRQQRWPKVSAVWIANVMGSRYERELARAVSRGLSLRACFAHSEAQFAGVRSGYREPERLGVDRWLAVLAAHRRAAGGVCVAMAGTALTLDAVNANGRHLGGMIAPGMSTLQRALLEAVRFRTRAAQPRLRASLGRDTDACVGAGTLFALLGALDRAAAQAGAETRLISGGDAALLIRHLPGWRLVPDLVLEGLWLRAGGGFSPTR